MSGEVSWDETGSGDMPFSERGWEPLALGVRSRPRYCSARFSGERMSASMSMSWFVSHWMGL